jgi:hypothetical protein
MELPCVVLGMSWVQSRASDLAGPNDALGLDHNGTGRARIAPSGCRHAVGEFSVRIPTWALANLTEVLTAHSSHNVDSGWTASFQILWHSSFASHTVRCDLDISSFIK